MAVDQGGIRVPIITYFNKKGLKDAEKGLKGLESNAKKLAKTLGVTLGSAAIVSFGKKAAMAFAQDQQAAALLANQLRNLGLQDAISGSESFIAAMQKQTGILDDELRPAYAELARVTGSVTKSQDMLKLAWDVSAGSGTDFRRTVDILSKAYLGNTKGLKELNIGLTQSELKTKSFAEIQKILSDQFSGAGATSLNTYAGQMTLFNTAMANASETIGKSLFDALALLSGDQGFGGFIDKVDTAAQAVADFIKLFSVGVKFWQIFLSPNTIWPEKLQQFDELKRQVRYDQISKSQRDRGMKMWVPEGAYTPAMIKAEEEARKRAKEILALQQKQNKAAAEAIKKAKEKAALDALQLKYKQASSIFDEAAIQLQAAAMGKQSDEDYARIKLKQDLMALQDAINAKDVVTATKLAAIVEEDYKRVQAYQAINIATAIQSGLIDNVAAATKLLPSNVDLINIDNLKSALQYIKDLITQMNNLPKTGATGGAGGLLGTGGGAKGINPPSANPKSSYGGTQNNPPLGDTPFEIYRRDLEGAKDVIKKNAEALQPIIDSGFFDLAYNASEFLGTNLMPYVMTSGQGAAYSKSQVTVNVSGNVTTEKDLVDAIVEGLNQVTASGVKPFVNRLDPQYL